MGDLGLYVEFFSVFDQMDKVHRRYRVWNSIARIFTLDTPVRTRARILT